MAKRAVKKAEAEAPVEVHLVALQDAVVEISIRGLTPVIPHKWSEKAKRLMPGYPPWDWRKNPDPPPGLAESKKSSPKLRKDKEPRNPKAEAMGCLYLLDGLPALPATGFKAAIVGACRFFERPTMVEAKQLIFVEGQGPEQLVPIAGVLDLREDTPRNANGSADLRYRYYIHNWSATLRIRYVPSRITEESVAALVDAAGRGGVGDWRPSSPKSYTGTFGTWRVEKFTAIERGEATNGK